jgi:hypothetical protein
MATVTLIARYLDLLKPQRKPFEVFDTIVPGLAIRVLPSGTNHSRCTTDTTAIYGASACDLSRLAAGSRKTATQHRGRIFDGADPAEEKKPRATDGDMV